MKTVNNISNFLERISTLLKNLSERVKLGDIYCKVGVYRDCYQTIASLLEIYQPEIIYDIGANHGQWSYVMSHLNPKFKYVVLFEPQKRYSKILNNLRLISSIDKKVYSVGLGDKNSAGVIRGGTSSASFLKADHSQNEFFPKSILNKKEICKIRKLDDMFIEDNLLQPDLIKVDVQGYELKILEGGRKVISKAKYLVIELSFRQFYKGQPKLYELLRFLEENRFRLVGKGFEWWSSKEPYQLLQMDAIFVNELIVK